MSNDKFIYKDGETSTFPEEIKKSMDNMYDAGFSHALEMARKIVEHNLKTLYPHATQKIIEQLDKLKSK